MRRICYGTNPLDFLHFHYRTGYWIGQNDISSENVWTHKGDATCNGIFYNFDSLASKPDGGTTKNCVVMPSDRAGKWLDVDCSSGDYYTWCKLQQGELLVQDI